MNEVYGTLADIVMGRKPGRTDDNMITVFDSTGVAIEDIAVAKLLYEKVNQRGNYTAMDIIGVSP